MTEQIVPLMIERGLYENDMKKLSPEQQITQTGMAASIL